MDSEHHLTYNDGPPVDFNPHRASIERIMPLGTQNRRRPFHASRCSNSYSGGITIRLVGFPWLLGCYFESFACDVYNRVADPSAMPSNEACAKISGNLTWTLTTGLGSQAMVLLREHTMLLVGILWTLLFGFMVDLTEQNCIRTFGSLTPGFWAVGLGSRILIHHLHELSM